MCAMTRDDMASCRVDGGHVRRLQHYDSFKDSRYRTSIQYRLPGNRCYEVKLSSSTNQDIFVGFDASLRQQESECVRREKVKPNTFSNYHDRWNYVKIPRNI